MLADVSKVFLELDIDILTMNVSNSKKGRATLSMSFDINGSCPVKSSDRKDTQY